MYQELELFEETFDGHPVWGTEGNDLPLPALRVGDLFEHESLPAINWRTSPKPGQAFKVTAIKHVFRETGPGPEADHLLKVAVALDDLESQQEAKLYQIETDLEAQTRRGDFLDILIYELAIHSAPEVQDKLIQSIMSSMKATPAREIEDEAKNTWEEAAIILQANHHLLADMLQREIKSEVQRAIAKLKREDRLIIWFAAAGLDDWSPDDFPNAQTGFDPLKHSRRTLETVESQLIEQVVSLLHAHDFFR